MKLKEFIDNLHDLVKQRPEIKEFDVVTAKDEEGNGFTIVCYFPTIGHFDKGDSDFEGENADDPDSSQKENNAICVN